MALSTHRYSRHQFDRTAVRQRRSKWVAAASLFLALGVLSVYILQNLGVLR
jgi:hypothetical protein